MMMICKQMVMCCWHDISELSATEINGFGIDGEELIQWDLRLIEKKKITWKDRERATSWSHPQVAIDCCHLGNQQNLELQAIWERYQHEGTTNPQRSPSVFEAPETLHSRPCVSMSCILLASSHVKLEVLGPSTALLAPLAIQGSKTSSSL